MSRWLLLAAGIALLLTLAAAGVALDTGRRIHTVLKLTERKPLQ